MIQVRQATAFSLRDRRLENIQLVMAGKEQGLEQKMVKVEANVG